MDTEDSIVLFYSADLLGGGVWVVKDMTRAWSRTGLERKRGMIKKTKKENTLPQSRLYFSHMALWQLPVLPKSVRWYVLLWQIVVCMCIYGLVFFLGCPYLCPCV